MSYDPEIHHRRSIRLRHYDYATAGFYFVTLCVQGRENLFGQIVDGAMVSNDAGLMVVDLWSDLPARYPGVTIDAFVAMPNHFHGIIILPPVVSDDDPVGAAPRGRPVVLPFDGQGHPQTAGHPQGGGPTMSLPDVVHRFKSLTTARYIHGVNNTGWSPFPGRLWQRNYYERIIRDENELTNARQYIANTRPVGPKTQKTRPTEQMERRRGEPCVRPGFTGLRARPGFTGPRACQKIADGLFVLRIIGKR